MTGKDEERRLTEVMKNPNKYAELESVQWSEAELRYNLSKVITYLQKKDPKCECIIGIVTDLAEGVESWHQAMMLRPGEPSPMTTERVARIRMHFNNLKDALSAKDVAKSLTHAEAAFFELS